MPADDAPPPAPTEEPPDWPAWEQRVHDPAGDLWRVRTVDLLRAATGLAASEARTIAGTMGRYQTTIERPDGGQRTVYTSETDEAEEYHRRTVRRILAGQL